MSPNVVCWFFCRGYAHAGDTSAPEGQGPFLLHPVTQPGQDFVSVPVPSRLQLCPIIQPVDSLTFCVFVGSTSAAWRPGLRWATGGPLGGPRPSSRVPSCGVGRDGRAGTHASPAQAGPGSRTWRRHDFKAKCARSVGSGWPARPRLHRAEGLTPTRVGTSVPERPLPGRANATGQGVGGSGQCSPHPERTPRTVVAAEGGRVANAHGGQRPR